MAMTKSPIRTNAKDKPAGFMVGGGAIGRLGAELALIRAAGFTSASRMERFTLRLTSFAESIGESSARVLAAAQTVANVIREDNERRERAELARKARRTA